MHEMSLVQGLLQQLTDLAGEHKAEKVTSITVEIGPLAGVVVDSFLFGFEVLAKEDKLTRQAELEIISPSVHYQCSNCGFEEMSDGQQPDCCGKCRETLLFPRGGDEIILRQVEME